MMRSPRVRFDVRRMMITVAVIAVVLSTGRFSYYGYTNLCLARKYAGFAAALRRDMRELPRHGAYWKVNLREGGINYWFDPRPGAVGIKADDLLQMCSERSEDYDCLARAHRFAAFHQGMSHPLEPPPPPFDSMREGGARP